MPQTIASIPLSPQPYAPLVGPLRAWLTLLIELLLMPFALLGMPFQSLQELRVKFQKTPNFLNPGIEHCSEWQDQKCLH